MYTPNKKPFSTTNNNYNNNNKAMINNDKDEEEADVEKEEYVGLWVCFG